MTTIKNNLWQFIDSDGSFRVQDPDKTSRLYFPLCNESGILSSITPDLHGDIKTNQNSFLMLPVTSGDLHNIKSSRNFWAHVEGKGAWSLTGVSALSQKDETELEAGFLWHKTIRENKAFGLRSEIINFAPATDDAVEIMLVTLQNTGSATARVTPTAAIPVFARSADNLRDHHHVTTLLNRISLHGAGILVKPTMSFDERGHKVNETIYSVLGVTESGENPAGIFPTVQEFIGEGGNLEAPQAVLENIEPSQKDLSAYQGRSAIAGLRFKTVALAPRQRMRFVLILGVAKKESDIDSWLRKYGTFAKAEEHLKQSKLFWKTKLDTVRFDAGNSNVNG
jgi:cellobiose phosphorylase